LGSPSLLMVDREDLEALDAILWRRTGQLAAAALGCHQATISRRLARCRQVFGVAMWRQQGEWECDGSPLLALERHLHQLGRFLGHAPLRIEAFAVGSGPLLLPLPEGWVGGTFDHVGVDRPLQLLRERVIDAWLCDAVDDLPQADLAELAVLPLWRAPVLPVAGAGHPLAAERSLTRADLLRFPSLDLPASGYLRSRALLREQGFGTLATGLRRYEPEGWEGRVAGQLNLAYSTPLHQRSTPALVLLEAEPLFSNGGALLCRLDQADQPAITCLEAVLRLRLRSLEAELLGCELL